MEILIAVVYKWATLIMVSYNMKLSKQCLNLIKFQNKNKMICFLPAISKMYKRKPAHVLPTKGKIWFRQ